jgi:serine/threonine protein phosphatase PrpC
MRRPPKLDVFGATDVGRVREVNEDQFVIADVAKSLAFEQTSLPDARTTRRIDRTKGKLLLVADGMGGHAAGDRASALVADSVSSYLRGLVPLLLQFDSSDEEELNRVLKAAVEKSAEVIAAEASRNPLRRGMGTTLTMAYVLWPTAFLVHVGDSRAYLLRGGEFEQLTTDHTIAQQLVEGGAMDEERARRTRWASVLWNVIGGSAGKLRPVVSKVPLQPGDALLLCTDGLTKHVSDEAIARILDRSASAEEACRALVDRANELGGRDNTTVIAARFV